MLQRRNLKVTKMRKMLQRRKFYSYQNTENVAKTEILLKDRKRWKDGNLTKIQKLLKRWKSY